MLESIERYYTAKVRRHGATPPGVDWSSALGQRLRFVQLLKVVADWNQPLSLHDLGCGYGALLAHLADCHAGAPIRYIGSDVSAEMVHCAQSQRRPCGVAGSSCFVVATATPPVVDYSVASGIFNVRLDHPVQAWEQHVATTLRLLCDGSLQGFAVNFMSPQALEARPAAAACLYGPGAEQWLAFCREVLGCRADLVSGYGLPEYTLLVRHPS